jgi:hypothetical protein
MTATFTVGAVWLPTSAASAQLDVTRRTLQRWARSGRVDTRTAPGGGTEYLVTPATPGPGRVAPPPTGTAAPATPATPGDVSQVERLLERALRAELALERAELEHATTRAELDTTRDLARDLASRLVRRGELVRRLARDLASARR